jgi:hypothetical protein
MTALGGVRFGRVYGGSFREDVRIVLVVGGNGQLNLDPVDAVDAVDEEDEDEDKGNLHPVLDLGDDGALGDEAVGYVCQKGLEPRTGRGRSSREQSPLDGEGKGQDEEHEEEHLQHQQHEHLSIMSASSRGGSYRRPPWAQRTRV